PGVRLGTGILRLEAIVFGGEAPAPLPGDPAAGAPAAGTSLPAPPPAQAGAPGAGQGAAAP
ncbi:MAG: flagellar motor protein MotA, partial [Deltaproteobacteria bacterium]|nr:flagellar motor protein MotA [Deltaproteobacteria bacterium]